MQRIFLIGYMGAGKTTVGLALAKKRELGFIDLDHFIEKRYRKSIAQLFSEQGEKAFRNIETKALNEVAAFEDVVISTGGGAPCFHDNLRRMNETGTSIYLKSSPALLAKRLNACKHSRPLIKNKTTEEITCFVEENLKQREPFYRQAHIILDIDEWQPGADVNLIALRLTEILDGRKNDENS